MAAKILFNIFNILLLPIGISIIKSADLVNVTQQQCFVIAAIFTKNVGIRTNDLRFSEADATEPCRRADVIRTFGECFKIFL
jgi:hypothetical protein